VFFKGSGKQENKSRKRAMEGVLVESGKSEQFDEIEIVLKIV